MRTKYFGDKKFYAMVLAVAMPIMIQNAITNFVGLLDNIMVGRVGELPMSGVAIVNQLLFVFNLCIFGAVSGSGIFTAQFHGARDDEGIRHTFRFKLMICGMIAAVGICLFAFASEPLISLYLKGEGAPEDIAATLSYGKEYLKIMLWGLVPFALTNIYSGTLRETGETMVPMTAGITAVLVNLFFNYVLIFGHFGLPAMGVKGAAIATVISRYVELAIVAGWTHLNSAKKPFIRGAYRSLAIPGALTKKLILKGLPLLVNEALWSAGMAMMNQCYSLRGLEVVAAYNISNTIWNVFSVSFLTMGNAVGIIIGQMLGAGKEREEVIDADRKLAVFSVLLCIVFGLGLSALSGVFPQIYDASASVRHLATQMILVGAFFMPFCAYTNASYFTLRSGGKVAVTLLFDCVFVWVVCVPLATCLAKFTALPIVPLYFCCQATEVIKCILGYIMLKKGTWVQNIVA